MIKDFKPLFFHAGELVFSRGNKVFKFNAEDEEELLFKIPVSLITTLLLYSRLAIRIFRLEVYSAFVHQNKFYICYQGKLYMFDVEKGDLRLEMTFKKGHGPLSFASGGEVKGFSEQIYFGDYFSDSKFDLIQIHTRDDNGNWEECYSFEEGQVNHIHALIPDKPNNCIWILTGDYGDSFGIYQAKNNFSSVEPILVGDQKYRSCVAYPFENGLLYATDSHLEQNTIRVLAKIDGEWSSSWFADINGPVIYGCELLDFYVFATSVEPGLVKSNIVATLLDTRKGPGIDKNQVEIIAVSKSTKRIHKIEENQKDFLPARIFQFGSAMFPSFSSHSNHLYTYYTATQSAEGQTKIIDLNQRCYKSFD